MYSIVLIYSNLFIHSSVDEHLGCLQYGLWQIKLLWPCLVGWLPVAEDKEERERAVALARERSRTGKCCQCRGSSNSAFLWCWETLGALSTAIVLRNLPHALPQQQDTYYHQLNTRTTDAQTDTSALSWVMYVLKHANTNNCFNWSTMSSIQVFRKTAHLRKIWWT